jgi:Flp pilus assembly protein TadG
VSKRCGDGKTKGQALVEFALVLPILLLFIFGIIDAGRLIYTFNTVANSARDGARVAIVNQSTTGTDTCDTTSATAWAKGCSILSGTNLGLTTTDVDVIYRDPTDTSACTVPTIGCIAVVTVRGQFQALTPIIGQIIGPTVLSSTTKVPVERVCKNPPPAPLANC